MTQIIKYMKNICWVVLLVLLCSCPYKTSFRYIKEQDGLHVNQSYAGYWNGYFNDGSYVNFFLKKIRKNVWSGHVAYHDIDEKNDSSFFLRLVPFEINKQRLVQIEDPEGGFYFIKINMIDKDKIYFKYLDKNTLSKNFNREDPGRSRFEFFLKNNLNSGKIWSRGQPLVRRDSKYDLLHEKGTGF